MRDFQMVDVFGSGPFSGNPVAVVFAADDLDTETMQRITRWFNLSETTFLLPPTNPDADYRVRIFTLERELPFAGHPTLGTCHAWLKAGGEPKTDNIVIQQCEAGLIQIRRTGERLAFQAPPRIRSGPVDDATLNEVLQVLRLDSSAIVEAQWADNGPGWIAVMLESAQAVLSVNAASYHPSGVKIGLVGPHEPGSDAAWEVRAIFNSENGTLIEDPVTGSLNASVAQWLFESGRAEGGYVAAQGTKLGRAGRIHVERDTDGAIWIGGATESLVSGKAEF
ncbi:MAG: PhzF family phenazine biosynthesis protein [Sphingomicrobium sp.]